MFLPSPVLFPPPPCLQLPTWQDLSLVPGERPGGVGLSDSELAFHVGGLAELHAALRMTLACHSLLSMACVWDG